MSDAAQPLATRRTLVAALVLSLLFIALLFLEGRPAWCKNGLGLWAAVRTPCSSQHLVDPYTLTHVLHGIIFYWLLRPLAPKLALHWRVLAALALEIGWEVLENSPWVIQRYRQDTAALGYTGDSVVNALADVAAAVLGIAFARRFSWKASVALFIVFELWVLYLARDNLTLNVFMLFFPIDAVKQWQLAV
jgi:Protein of unknown function (DUF2585)